MFIPTENQYADLIKKAKYISYQNAMDIVHDSILRYDSFDMAFKNLIGERFKYCSINAFDETLFIDFNSCKYCNEVYTTGFFVLKKNGNKTCITNVCKKCNSDYKANWRLKNAKKCRSRNRKYQNSEKGKITKKIWNIKNRDRINELRKTNPNNKTYNEVYAVKNKKQISDY